MSDFVSVPCECGARNKISCKKDPNRNEIVQTPNGLRWRFLLPESEGTCYECFASISISQMVRSVDGSIWPASEEADQNHSQYVLAKIESFPNHCEKWWKNVDKVTDDEFRRYIRTLFIDGYIIFAWNDGMDFYRDCRNIEGWNDKNPPLEVSGAVKSVASTLLKEATESGNQELIHWISSLLESYDHRRKGQFIN